MRHRSRACGKYSARVIVSCLVSTSALAQPQKRREINISSESAPSRVLAMFLAALDAGSFQVAYDLTKMTSKRSRPGRPSLHGRRRCARSVSIC